MTEALQQSVGGALPVPELSRVRSYWAVVLAAFWRSVAVRVSVGLIAVLVVTTIAAPFIANGQPFTILRRQPDGAWVRHWPLFRTLTNVDLAVLVFAAGAVAYAWLHWRAGRRGLPMEDVRLRRFVGLLLVLAAATAGSVLLFVLHRPVIAMNDYRDYQQLEAAGQARDAVFPVIPWRYGDQEPLELDRTNQLPSRQHWLGTDQIGRDVLSRLIWSTRVVMGIGFVSQGIALFIGVVIGALIGYASGTVDLLGMRLVEIFESIPTFFLILIFIAVYGRDIFMIMVILGLVGWTGIARFVRAEFLRLRQTDFVQAAIASGLPLRRVLFRHMLPNGLTPVIVTVTFGIAGAIMAESGLSFLGVGVEPPTPSWGQMLNDAGNPAEAFRWWLAMPPGIMIFLTVFAYNIIGEGLRDAIDPRLNKLE